MLRWRGVEGPRSRQGRGREALHAVPQPAQRRASLSRTFDPARDKNLSAPAQLHLSHLRGAPQVRPPACATKTAQHGRC